MKSLDERGPAPTAFPNYLVLLHYLILLRCGEKA
jgi:hypothetical protein